MDDIVSGFLVECREGFDQLERDLVTFEQRPHDADLLGRIFRVVHSIKGNCGFLGFPRLEALTHAGEDVLVRLRDGGLAPTRETGSALLAMLDAARTVVTAIERDGAEPDVDLAPLCRQLQLAAMPAAGEAAHHRISEIVVAPGDLPAMFSSAPAAAVAVRAPTGSAPASRSVRVDAGTLDGLLALAGDMSRAAREVVRLAGDGKSPALVTALGRLDALAEAVRSGATAARRQQLDAAWQRYPRLVRELSVACNKPVTLEVDASGIAVDHAVIEALTDPLTHLIRNAVDHGIEPADVRQARGKPAEGRVRLSAMLAGGCVIVEVSDDGGGFDVERLRAAAIARGIVSREQVATYGVREALDLAFIPGLSTAARASHISGRGVGMDVVRTNIELVGGRVEITTSTEAGTTVRLELPSGSSPLEAPVLPQRSAATRQAARPAGAVLAAH